MAVSGLCKVFVQAVSVVFLPLCAFAGDDCNTPAPAPVYGYEIVKTFPHDRDAFTQGLVFSKGFLYEGTGRYGKSELRKQKLKTGEIILRRKLKHRYFGEGVTMHCNRIIQLTWKSRKGFVYDSNSFELLHTFAYATQGWGITHDDKRLIISDGSSTLHFLDPNTFEPAGKLRVHDNNIPLLGLNELEYVKGTIYANIWGTDRIAAISPKTGRVCAWIDLKGIVKPKRYGRTIDVLNGIAYDIKDDRLFITGKLWPQIFEIKFVPPKQNQNHKSPSGLNARRR